MNMIKRKAYLSGLVTVWLALLTLSLGLDLPGGSPWEMDHTAFAQTRQDTSSHNAPAPSPLMASGQPVDWWFVFKFNAATFPGCGENGQSENRTCRFGGMPQHYRSKYSQQYVYASSAQPTLQKGMGCAGDTLTDPVGATFDQVYNGKFSYVIWNDQFYDDPPIKGCHKACSSPWGHSKGLLAWNDLGEGLVMQVSTPSWPASGSAAHPRQNDGNTLGCVKDDNVEVSQHFFSLKLTKDDLVTVLQALQNASVVTDPSNPQIVRNGGPADVQTLVEKLGHRSHSSTPTTVTLSSGVVLISKPSKLHVPPWQLVSASLKGLPLRTANWWARPKIYSTTASQSLDCWDTALGTPGPVQIATSGQWQETAFSLTGGEGGNHNHAKIGVSLDAQTPVVIFGDMNQQGALSPGDAYTHQKCSSSQNGRGGTFYVVRDAALSKSLAGLIAGETAPDTRPEKK